MTPRVCAVLPTYDNAGTIRAMVEAVRVHLPHVLVVDDGSGPEGREAVAALGREGLAEVHHLPRNTGKGAAVKEGFRRARAAGFTHAVQIDADGQHEVGDLPRFLAAVRAHPDALVLGEPLFDRSAPPSRVRGHRFCSVWTDLATGGRVIRDPLCGYRVYPLEAALRRRRRRPDGVRRRDRRPDGLGGLPGGEPPHPRPVPDRRGGRGLPLPALARQRPHRRPARPALPGGAGAAGRRLHAQAGAGGAVTAPRWHELPEKGSALGIRAVVGLLLLLGRRGAGWLVRLLAAWYVLLYPEVRRASRAYLRRAGAGAGLLDVVRHVFTFARVSADRVFLVRGQLGPFRVERHGGEQLGELHRQGRGVLLLLAHLGSWEVLRVHSREARLPVSVLAYYENSRGVTDALRALDPSL